MLHCCSTAPLGAIAQWESVALAARKFGVRIPVAPLGEKTAYFGDAMKQLPGKITISRVSGSSEYIRIVVVDEKSGCEIVEARLEFDEYARALTGEGRVNCRLRYNETSLIGKTKQTKRVVVPCSPEERRDADLGKLLAPFEVDGWIGRIADLTNPHNREGDGYSVIFERWI